MRWVSVEDTGTNVRMATCMRLESVEVQQRRVDAQSVMRELEARGINCFLVTDWLLDLMELSDQLMILKIKKTTFE